jgi:hypothetical protein
MKDRTRYFKNILKLCMICTRVWEVVYIDKRNTNRIGFSYYEDFPSYGKERENCPQCLGQNSLDGEPTTADEYNKGEVK